MLKITDDIPHGNVTAVEINQDGEMDVVSFAADAHGGLERMWFCFRIINDGQPASPRKMKLILKHYESMLGGNATNESVAKLYPVIRQENGDWQRLPVGQPLFHQDGKMDAFWTTEMQGQTLDVALCFPYGPPEIEQLINDYPGYWQWDEIGVSQQANPLHRLSNTYGDLENDQPGIFILARQHAAEVSGSWVLDGFLRQLSDKKPDLAVWCVPFANIDGVLNGDYGKNPFPHDVNRAWDPGRQMRHETKVYMQDLNRWQHRCKPALVLDFHSPGIVESGIYSFTNEENEKKTRIRRIFETFEKYLGDKANDPFIKIPNYKPNSVWGEYKSVWEHVEQDLDIRCVTFESSYMSDPQGVVFTQAGYQQAGRSLADGLLEVIQTIYVGR